MRLYILFIYSTLFFSVSLTFSPKSAGGAFSWPNIILVILTIQALLLSISRRKIRLGGYYTRKKVEYGGSPRFGGNQWLVLGFLIIALLGMFIAIDIGKYYTYLIAILRGIVLVFITPVIILNRKDLLQAINAIATIALIGSVASLIQQITFLMTGFYGFGGNSFVAYIGNNKLVRVTGFFLSDPNIFAVYLLIGITIYTSRLFNDTDTDKNTKAKHKNLLALLLLITALILTFSRGAAIGFILFACYHIITSKISLKSLGWFLVIIPVAVVIVTIILQSRGFEDASIGYRRELLEESITIAKDHPLTGIGLGNILKHTTRSQAAHNMFLEVVTSTGVFGLLFFTSIIFKALYKTRSYPPLHNALIIILCSSVFLSFLTNVMFWLVIALQTSLEFIVRDERMREERYIRINRPSYKLSQLHRRLRI